MNDDLTDGRPAHALDGGALDGDAPDGDAPDGDVADDQSGHISDSPDPLDHMAENFGLDAEPGTKGVKASGAGLSGGVSGNTTGSNDPDTYRDAPRSGAKTGGGGL